MTIDAISPQKPTLVSPLRLRDFRLLWVGVGVSSLGDQFMYVALPWLALQLTGDELVVGLVRTMMGLALGLFMLFGGALSDRSSPYVMMIVSNVALGLLALAAVGLIVTDTLSVWSLLLIAFLFGMGGAFFEPAYYAVLPRILPEDDLKQGNALMSLTFQLNSVVGPGLAGAVIGLFGLGFIFGLDALTFAVVVIAVLLMRRPKQKAKTDEVDEEKPGLLASIREGINYAWSDAQLRALLILIFLLNGALNPAIGVGATLLADQRFTRGATDLGLMLAGAGAGALLGTLLGGSRYFPKAFGQVLMGVTFVLGFGTIGLGYVPSVWWAFLITFTVGITIGAININMITWIQKRVPADRLGRVMSLVMFGAVSFQPIGFTLAGLISRYSVTLLFTSSGVLLLIMALYTSSQRDIRQMQML
jgi:MFS family permease